MVKTVGTTTSNGATKKKSLFGKIFKKKSKKKNEDKEEEPKKVEILVENVVEQVEETREETREEEIPRDPSATSPRPVVEQEEVGGESADPDREPVFEERDGADILADLQDEEENPTPVSHHQQGWIGGWLEGMTNLCGPPTDQGLPTIMSGEEMDMDMITNGETTSVMSPTSTVQSEAPLSPVAPRVEEEEGELNKKRDHQPAEETTSNKKEEPKEEKKAKVVLVEPPKQEEPEPSPRAPVDAPTTPKSLVMSPRGATMTEEVEDLLTTTTEEEPKEQDDSTVGDNTLVVSPQKDDTAQESSAEPTGAKMDIFSSFTACCNPVAAPSMDETEGGIKAEDDESTTAGGPQDPDGDKEAESKSVHQDSQSVAAEEKKEGETTAASAPTTPVNKDAPPEEDGEPERIVGTIHKVKKNSKMGLSLKNSTMYQGVFIAKIKAGSLFSKTDLREGMQVLQIQGQPCPTVLEEAVNMLRHAVGDLEIVAQKPKCEI